MSNRYMAESEGVAYLTYKAGGRDDLIDSYSGESYELPSDELTGFIEAMQAEAPPRAPLVLLVCGDDLPDELRRSTERSLRLNYLIYYADKCYELGKLRVKAGIFLLCTLLAFLLMVVTSGIAGPLLSQYAYSPFAFFGYRLITLLVFDLRELLTERGRLAQLITMKVVFGPESVLEEASDKQVAEWKAEIVRNRAIIKKSKTRKEFVDELLMHNGTAVVSMRVNDVSEVLNGHCTGEFTLLDPEFGEYIDEVGANIPRSTPAVIELVGGNLSESDRELVREGIRNHFALKGSAYRRDRFKMVVEIGLFAACLAVSSVLMECSDFFGDMLVSELVAMLFWFFIDYLLEFVVLGFWDQRREARIKARLATAEVRFR